MSPLAPARRTAPAPQAALRLAAALEATAPRSADSRAVADERLLPVPDAPAPLVPGAGLARGSVTEAADPGLLRTLAGSAARDRERARIPTASC